MPFKHALLGLGVLFATVGQAAEIERVPSTYPNSPILQSATLPPGTALTFVSGILPDPADPKAAKDDLRAAGDTEAQTVAVLRKVEAALAPRPRPGRCGATAGVPGGRPETGRAHGLRGPAARLPAVLRQREQPLKPTRTTVQVAGLVLPGALIEVEAVAAKAR